MQLHIIVGEDLVDLSLSVYLLSIVVNNLHNGSATSLRVDQPRHQSARLLLLRMSPGNIFLVIEGAQSLHYLGPFASLREKPRSE